MQDQQWLDSTWNLISSQIKIDKIYLETHRGNIGIFDAPAPWGPWTTVLYEKDWGKGHFPQNTFYWNFSNKWTDNGGKNVTLIFCGRKENDSFNNLRGTFKPAGN